MRKKIWIFAIVMLLASCVMEESIEVDSIVYTTGDESNGDYDSSIPNIEVCNTLSKEKLKSAIPYTEATKLVFDLRQNVDASNLTASGHYVDEKENNLQVYCKDTEYYVLSESNDEIVAPEDCSFLFADTAMGDFVAMPFKEIVFNSFDTRNVTTMSVMFAGCDKLESLDLSCFVTSCEKVLMFGDCSNLKTVIINPDFRYGHQNGFVRPGSREEGHHGMAGLILPATPMVYDYENCHVDFCMVINVNGEKFDMIRMMEYVEFVMGSDESVTDADDWEKPAHKVNIWDEYYIGKTEVTQRLWKAVMGYNPSSFKGDDLPVENVSWYEVNDFLQKLKSLTGMDFRLPTEAEWELAARGGVRSENYKFSGSNHIDNVAWYSQNAKGTRAVGLKASNELGLFDMSGNVSEWCKDAWSDTFYETPYSLVYSPVCGGDDSSPRVVRGGDWDSGEHDARVTNRRGLSPETKKNSLGFRLAFTTPIIEAD